MSDKENKEVKTFYEEKRIKEIKDSGKRTPLNDVIYTVEFVNSADESIEVAAQKLDIIKTFKASDASKARTKIVDHLGSKIYAMIVEYGLTLPEVDPVLNKTVALVNDGQVAASNILWGVGHENMKTLLGINAILTNKYAGKTEKKEDSDGAAS